MMAPFKVAVYLYNGADVLDFSGPVEIYTAGPMDGPGPFTVTSFAHHTTVTASSPSLVYTPNATFQEMKAKIQDFDVLVIPGAQPKTISELIQTEDGKALCALLRKFVATKPRAESGKRILQSVCTGALLLAASNILAGRDVTTHHITFDYLKKIADEAAGGDSKVNVKRTRWADGGHSEAGVRIITAGGVSSGIDTSLYIVGELAGKEAADWAADLVEFERRSKGFSE
ncbi:class I glutamine amidotransferase-like protein [Ampelomyces quisqualis]|uniref:Class I glutamine amidotransferase-like protein n=1 Tax=Ampelomyces quisqualis TaxID=50730 RepID=A0A6A5QXE1_AMPQU|nr:class I glutamine amidotransferase-like protein [Ampelomyces quisqualis]